MNYNILCYTIYAVITIYIIIWVGKLFHRNGRVFIIRLFNNNISLADTTNNIILVAYYLFNIGYAVIQFSFWEQVANAGQLIASIADKTGMLILILAATHYCNLFIIYTLSKKSTFITPKTS